MAAGNAQLVQLRDDVKFSIELGLSKLVQGFLSQGNQVLVPDSDSIELRVVNTQA